MGIGDFREQRNDRWVSNSLFDEDLLSGLDLVLKWVVLGVGFHISEGIKDPMEARDEGIIPFVRWTGRVDRDDYRMKVLTTLEDLKLALDWQGFEVNQQVVVEAGLSIPRCRTRKAPQADPGNIKVQKGNNGSK